MRITELQNNLKIEQRATEIESVSFSDVILAGIDSVQNTKAEEIMDYGYSWLDDRLGGIFPGQVVLIGGESGTGKSTFSVGIVCRQKVPTAIFALEESLADYGKKALYFEIGKIRKKREEVNYPYTSYVRGDLNNQTNFIADMGEAYNNLKKEYPLFQNVKEAIIWEVVEKRIRLLSESGVKMILIDHLHYFDLLAKDSSKNDYIEKIMIKMARLAIETNIAIILVAHYRKLNGNKPTMDSFKDSMSIVQNSNTVINLWRNREQGVTDEEKYKTQIIINKSRIVGAEGSIEVFFNPASGLYESQGEFWANGVPIVENNVDKLELSNKVNKLNF